MNIWFLLEHSRQKGSVSAFAPSVICFVQHSIAFEMYKAKYSVWPENGMSFHGSLVFSNAAWSVMYVTVNREPAVCRLHLCRTLVLLKLMTLVNCSRHELNLSYISMFIRNNPLRWRHMKDRSLSPSEGKAVSWLQRTQWVADYLIPKALTLCDIIYCVRSFITS